MKVALIYGGQPRFRKCFFENLTRLSGFTEAHLYFYLWKEYDKSSIFDIDGIAITENNAEELIRKNIPANFILKKFEHVDIPSYDSLVPKEVERIPMTQFSPGGIHYLERMYKQHFGIKKAFDMIVEYYDCVIRHRVDCFMESVIDISKFNLDEGLYVPENYRYSIHNVYPIVNDQYAIGNMKTMKIYSSLFEHMTDYFKSEHQTLHLETALSCHLFKNNIKILSTGTDNIINR